MNPDHADALAILAAQEEIQAILDNDGMSESEKKTAIEAQLDIIRIRATAIKNRNPQ